MQWKLIIALVFALLVALFAIQNAQTVDIHFLGFKLADSPVAGVIIGMLAIGVLLGVVFSTPGTLGRGRKIKELESQLKRKDEDLNRVTSELKRYQEEAFTLKTKLEELEHQELRTNNQEQSPLN